MRGTAAIPWRANLIGVRLRRILRRARIRSDNAAGLPLRRPAIGGRGPKRVKKNLIQGSTRRYRCCDPSRRFLARPGAGIEYAIDRNWSAKLEYLHVGLNNATYLNDLIPQVNGVNRGGGVTLGDEIVRAGVNYRTDWRKW